MDTDLQSEIESFLLGLASWCPAEVIVERFGVPERRLRADGRRPGLLDGFAVSSTRNGANGYIHHKFLPTEEWLPIKHRLRKHAVAELRRVKVWSQARARVLMPAPQPTERHTGQLVMAL
jgi:hypothetical protein